MTLNNLSLRALQAATVVIVVHGGIPSAHAQSETPIEVSRLDQASPGTAPNRGAHGNDVTAVAIAPDGSWGLATELASGWAIAKAIKNCREMFNQEIGCGYRLALIRGGWILLRQCGHELVLVADQHLDQAERAAAAEEKMLRTLYVLNMPPCENVLRVNPHGEVRLDSVLATVRSD